jgi:hypothetical protein
MDALTADEKGLIACAIQHPNGFPVKPEYLADCERLSERGWLDRQVVDDQIVWTLSRAATRRSNWVCRVGDAKEAMN